jgi:hypothetical protein
MLRLLKRTAYGNYILPILTDSEEAVMVWLKMAGQTAPSKARH